MYIDLAVDMALEGPRERAEKGYLRSGIPVSEKSPYSRIETHEEEDRGEDEWDANDMNGDVRLLCTTFT